MGNETQLPPTSNSAPANQNDDDEDTLTPTSGRMLNSIQPVPVIVSRSDGVPKRGRHFAGLPTSPEHIQHRRGKSSGKSISSSFTGKQESKNKRPSKTKSKRPKAVYESVEDEMFCIVCSNPYKTSRGDWLQCGRCEIWGHAKCAKKKDPLYIYYHCESGKDSE